MATAKEYAYTGRNAANKVVKGRIDGSTEGVVVSRLRALGISPITVTEASASTGFRREITLPGFEKGVKLKDLAVMARQMSTMISSGLTLIRTLSILAEQTENKVLGATLETVRTEVEAGSALSDAMARQVKIFPPLMISLVRAGEAGGFLEQTLQSIAVSFEKDVKLRSTIKSALTYPVAVLIIAFVAVVGMLIFVVPIFQQMFDDLGGELPLPTQFLVLLSNNMIWIGPLLLVAIIAFSAWWRANKNEARVMAVVDPIRLRIPVFGGLFKKVAIARFTRNFGTMIGSGVPILQSLKIVGETSGNYVIESALVKVAESVRQGKSISGPLALEPVFPSMVVQMIAVGEDSGSLETMLRKVADFYDEEVEATAEQLTALIEPLMIAVIGAVIGGMIVALYLPIFSIFDQIK
jgi:type IV pilus assembly protein PilC